MPGSDTTLWRWIGSQLQERAPDAGSFLDVGTGYGNGRDFFGGLFPAAHWTGIEIWPAYKQAFDLADKYDTLIIGDARETDLPAADVCLFCDVLEHMTTDEALGLWIRARAVCRWVVIAIPVEPYPQGAEHGNPYETHVATWDTQSVLDVFDGIVAWTDNPHVGAFIAQGLA